MQRILILSLDPIRTELVRATLSGLDVELRVATSKEAFRRLTEQLVYDLVIVLDAAPFFSGRALFRRVRPRPLRRPKIYVISWQQAEQTVVGLLESGVDQYMTFPLNPVRLRAKVIGDLMR